jgi:hypothetical protein
MQLGQIKYRIAKAMQTVQMKVENFLSRKLFNSLLIRKLTFCELLFEKKSSE